MPNLSASDYTTYLKLKAAAASPIAPAIQTRTNATLSQSVLNANLLTSQAAFVTTPSTVVPVVQATVTGASTTTVTAALTDIIDGAVGNGTLITYTTSQPHGLATFSFSPFVTIEGLGQGDMSTSPNVSNQLYTVTGPNTFTLPVAATGTATGTGRFVSIAYYTTSVAHGLVTGSAISVTGITTFTATNAPVAMIPTPTTFALIRFGTGTGVSGQSGSIVGRVYYTTATPHGLTAGTQNVSVSGLARYNFSLASVFNVPSTTVFTVTSTETGAAVTGGTGVVTITFFGNTAVSITGLNYVRARPPNQVNNPRALSTIATGTLSSSRVQQPGGLPTGFKNSQGSYHRIPQQAGWGT